MMCLCHADFGPLTRTENADIFKERINSLSATGGGDAPEMCLSGLLVCVFVCVYTCMSTVFTCVNVKITRTDK